MRIVQRGLEVRSGWISIVWGNFKGTIRFVITLIKDYLKLLWLATLNVFNKLLMKDYNSARTRRDSFG